jgi:hypothetical protein
VALILLCRMPEDASSSEVGLDDLKLSNPRVRLDSDGGYGSKSLGDSVTIGSGVGTTTDLCVAIAASLSTTHVLV